MKIKYLVLALPALFVAAGAQAQTAVPINGVAPQICELTTAVDNSTVTLTNFVSTAGANIGAVTDSNVVARPAALFCNVAFGVSLNDNDSLGLVNPTAVPAGASAAYRNTLDYGVGYDVGGRAVRPAGSTRFGSNGSFPAGGYNSGNIAPTPAAGPEALNLTYQVLAAYNPGVLPVPGTYTSTNTFSIVPRP